MHRWKRSTLIVGTSFILLAGSGCSLLDGKDKDLSEGDAAGVQPPVTQVAPLEPPSNQETIHNESVKLYYPDDDLMSLYYIEVSLKDVKVSDAPMKALELWLEGPPTEDLIDLVPEGVKVQSVKDQNGVAYVSFSKELQQANLGGAGEQFLMESIALLMLQFGYETTQILVEGNTVESILGHVTADVPFEAPDPKQYSPKSS